MSKKRFSRKGLEQLETNFEIVELLLKSTKIKLKRLEKELNDLETNRTDILIKDKCVPKYVEFYNQRLTLCDRDIANLREKIQNTRQDNQQVVLCFKRCYYLMYGKPKLCDLKN